MSNENSKEENVSHLLLEKFLKQVSEITNTTAERLRYYEITQWQENKPLCKVNLTKKGVY